MRWKRSVPPSRGRAWLLTAVSGIAGAVAAGALPDVIKGTLGDGMPLLAGLCAGAVLIFAWVNYWQQRRHGVGIVVAIQAEPGRGSWNTHWWHAAEADVRRRHESCFTVLETVPELRPGATSADNRNWVQERRVRLHRAADLVTARLIEATSAEPTVPVSLYVNARLPEAVYLGAAMKFNISQRVHAMGDDAEHDANADLTETVEGRADPVIAQRSERPDTTFYPALRLSGRLKDPLTPPERDRVLRLVSVNPAPDFAADPAGEALALVVHLAPNPRMVTEALDAAGTGCLDVTGAWARCRGALVISGGPANLPEDMKVFELITRFVYAEWTAWLAARDDPGRVSARLFAATPAAIGVALGWLFGHAMTPVPYKYVYERLA